MPWLHTKAPAVLNKHTDLSGCICLSQTTMNKTSNKESSPNPVLAQKRLRLTTSVGYNLPLV